MKKEYVKITRQVYNETMQPIGKAEETSFTSLIAEKGKVFHNKKIGFTGGTRVDIGSDDREENYEEIDDPKYAEVIDTIVEGVSGNEQ